MRKKGLGRCVASVGAVALATLFNAGCGNTYRPVVSAINPVGPAGQPNKYAVAVSNPAPTLPGLLTFVDFSGDTTISTPSILTNPSYYTQASSGGTGYVLDTAGIFQDFGQSSPTALLTTNIPTTTLPAGINPVNLEAINVGNAGTTLFVPEGNGSNKIAELSASGPTLIQELAVPPTPVFVVGYDGAARVYALSQNGGSGVASSIEPTTLSTSATINVGNLPVYGVMSVDGKRAYILNKGSGTVSVINVINNALDTVPVIPATGTLGVNPVWADLSTVNNELVVLNAGNGTTAGTLSIINIPLCTTTTQTSNPNCDTNNPVDAVGFGNVLANVPVGINPTMVSVLHDGSRAYVVNQKDSTGACNSGEGSVTVVNLLQGVVETTICAISTPSAIATANGSPTLVYGHPTNIAATTGSPTGKVYVTSPDSVFMTVIYTDTDTVQTHITLQGAGMLPAGCTSTQTIAACDATLPSATVSQPVGLHVTSP